MSKVVFREGRREERGSVPSAATIGGAGQPLVSKENLTAPTVGFTAEDFKVRERGTWAQVRAERLAWVVAAALGVLVVVATLFFWFAFDRPSLADLRALEGTGPEAGARALERFRELDGVSWNRFHSLVQYLVGTVLLPLLTLLLGYAFGQRGSGDGRS